MKAEQELQPMPEQAQAKDISEELQTQAEMQNTAEQQRLNNLEQLRQERQGREQERDMVGLD